MSSFGPSPKPYSAESRAWSAKYFWSPGKTSSFADLQHFLSVLEVALVADLSLPINLAPAMLPDGKWLQTEAARFHLSNLYFVIMHEREQP